jgi:SAM-dependent methyltransferase
MPKTQSFDQYFNDYEHWFIENKYVYFSELEAVRHFIPPVATGVEIGIGSGQFAAPLGISVGIDPSESMLKLAKARQLTVVRAAAENLPFTNHSFDFALMVTTVCFVDDLKQSFSEVIRILKSDGSFVIAFVDKNSPLGKLYLEKKQDNVFYREALFYSTDELKNYLSHAGFIPTMIVQTVFGKLKEINAVQPFHSGYGKGGFVVIKAELS